MLHKSKKNDCWTSDQHANSCYWFGTETIAQPAERETADGGNGDGEEYETGAEGVPAEDSLEKEGEDGCQGCVQAFIEKDAI